MGATRVCLLEKNSLSRLQNLIFFQEKLYILYQPGSYTDKDYRMTYLERFNNRLVIIPLSDIRE